MIAFEVYLNGEKLCTAGLGDLGVVSAILGWRGTQPYKDGTAPEGPALDFSVRDLTSPAAEHVEWAHPEVHLNDEIRIRLVESTLVDEPRKLGA
jgi:hypothetical protein